MTTSIRSKQPSSRDFEIFRLSEILGLTHAEIALTSAKLTRRRVSQIIANVRRWLSLHPCQDPRLASELQRKQLARHTERLHLEQILSQARGQLIYGNKELTTTTTKDDGTKTTTVRQQPFNVQLLKTYLRTVEALAKLQQEPDVSLPTPEQSPFPWLEGAINEVYDKWFKKIWSGQLKPHGICDLVEEIVAAVLKAARQQQLAVGWAAPTNSDDGRASPDPAEPSPARSASEGHVPSNTTDSDEPAVGRGSPDPAPLASSTSNDIEPSTDNTEHQDCDSAAPPSTEYSVLSTQVYGGSPSPVESTPSTSDLGPETMDRPSTPSIASIASPREAPPPDPALPADDATTPCTANTSTPSPSPKTDPPASAPSPENPKREALPLSVAPSLPPAIRLSLPLSLAPS